MLSFRPEDNEWICSKNFEKEVLKIKLLELRSTLYISLEMQVSFHRNTKIKFFPLFY